MFHLIRQTKYVINRPLFDRLTRLGLPSGCLEPSVGGRQLGTELLSLHMFSARVIQEDRPASKSSSAEALSPSPPPWTPTRELHKRKTLPKRMGHLLQMLEKEKEEESLSQLERPEFGPGDVLELKLSVPENKRRTTVFKGICIARRNRGWRTSFTVRNFIGSSGGIERSFPL